MMMKKQWVKSFTSTVCLIFCVFTLCFAQKPQKQPDGSYRFVDESGKVLKKLGRWKLASGFWHYADNYAKVKGFDGAKYYLTRSGKTYKLAWGLQRLTLDKEALCFSPVFLTKKEYIKIFSHPQLKIIIIDRGSCQLNRHDVQTLMARINTFKKLEVLDIDMGNLKEIPKEIGELTELKYLGLQNQLLERIPLEISNLKSLQALDLSDNQIKYLPVFIGQLTRLKRLNLSRNSLVRISSRIGQLKQLQILNLNCNRVSFASYVDERSQIRYLKLKDENSSLKELPKEILKLSKLKELNLSENKGLKLTNVQHQLQLKLPNCSIGLPHSKNRY
ncbi:hypothetical protein BKI52_05630 [marine bacterium AO1-C]|nr:hypothetical protein BKI52_05630 [marine bacterium AO1-C]